MSSSGGESHQYSNISATTANFGLLGGTYGFDVTATWNSGSVQLEMLSLDGSTWVNVGSAVSTNGYSTEQLPPGQYRIAVTSASAVYAALSSIPD